MKVQKEDLFPQFQKEILTKLHQQIRSCTPSNLDVAPSLIEQTNRLVGINLSIGASINNLLIER